MSRAGMDHQTILPPELIEEIHFRYAGDPRLINAICDNLLLTAFAMESRAVTLEMLDEVSADMRLEYPEERPACGPQASMPAGPTRVDAASGQALAQS